MGIRKLSDNVDTRTPITRYFKVASRAYLQPTTRG